MENISPNVKRQKAVTPQLLRYLETFSSGKITNDPEDHVTDLMIGGYFFAMQSYEFSKTKKKGKTKMIRLGRVKFPTKNYKAIQHSDPDLPQTVAFIWILFEEQKNAEKYKARTQSLSEDRKLCPVRCLVQAVQRVLKYVPGADEDTSLFSIRSKPDHKSNFITNSYMLKLLRNRCALGGGKGTFGFNPHKIGNKNLQSGATMGFLLKRCSSDKVMILGRWKTKAFLDYIRPQVVELTTGLSKDMISFDTFFELCLQSMTIRENSEPLRRHYDMLSLYLDMTRSRMAG